MGEICKVWKIKRFLKYFPYFSILCVIRSKNLSNLHQSLFQLVILVTKIEIILWEKSAITVILSCLYFTMGNLSSCHVSISLWEILAKSVQKTFSCKVEFKPVTSRIFKCQSHLAIKFYSYFWWISRNLNKVLKTHRNFAFYQSFGRFFQVFLTYTLSEHVRACNSKTGKCTITLLIIKCWIFPLQLVPKGFMPSKLPHPHSKIY